MSAKILEKASELAEAIAECDELEVMRKAELVMNNDPESVKIIGEFQDKQKQVYDSQMRGGEIGDDVQQEIKAIEDKMSGNPAIKAYMEASDKFEQLMRSVNMVIARAVSGGDGGCSCGSECGPDCEPECGPSCGCN